MTCFPRISMILRCNHSLKLNYGFLRPSLYFRGNCGAHIKEHHEVVASFKCYSSQQTDSSGKLAPVYHGSLTNRVRNIKMFTLSTSFVSILMQPFIYFKAMETGNPVPVFIIFAMISIFSLCTPPLVHFVTKKYITHLYYNAKKDTYVATTYSLLIRKRQLEFMPHDVVVPAVTGMFTSIRIKGKPYFLDESEFQDIDHYKRIMGFDKPIDFQLREHSDRVQTTISENKIHNKS